MNRQAIKRKNLLAGIVTIIILIVAIILCIYMVCRINLRMNESATTSLLNTTQVIADTLNDVIENDCDALAVVGAVFVNNGVQRVEEELEVFRKTMELDWIGIVDEHGNGVDSLGNRYLISEYEFAVSWDLRKQGYSKVYKGIGSGRPQITLWSPIYEDDRYLGAVLGNVIMTQYYSANIFTFYNGAGRTYIFDSSDGSWVIKSLGTDGTATLQTDIYSLLSASGNKEEDINAFKQTVEAGKIGTAVLDFNGELSYLCFLPLQSSPGWYATTVIAKDTLLRESSEVQQTIGWVLAILCIAIAFSAVTFALWQVRKTKMEEWHYRETLFANISANLDSAFLIKEESNGKVAFVSDNIKRLLGLDRLWLSEDASRLFDWCKIPQDDPQRIAFLEGRLEKPTVREVVTENELGEETRTIRLELIPADMGQDLAVLTDVTRDKDIQRSLIDAMECAKAASNAKNDFLSTMSHDLRTPINGIVGLTAIAAAHLDDQNRVRNCLAKISESTEHLVNLVNEVLEMSQLESGNVEPASVSFNIAELLQEVLNMNYPGIQQKQHTFKVHIHLMEHEDVIGDPVKLTRIATNLISNAIKYTPTGGRITLTLRETAPMYQDYGCYELTVEDNGIGMSEEFRQKLFEPFEREGDVRIRRIQGTGLGMSIVKNIVELMMGSIQVESEKDKGSTFRVVVNLRLDESKNSSTDILSGMRVLVVDDDVDCRKTVVDILSSMGVESEWTDSVARAAELVRERYGSGKDFRAVIVDWKMPDMDGVAAAESIRAASPSPDTAIVLMAYDNGEAMKIAEKAGIDAFLSKPVYKAKLLRAMTGIAEGNGFRLKPPDLLPSMDDIPGGCTVLIVEDNELNKEIAVELLRMMGVSTECAEDGVEAVKCFSESEPGRYDLILMDIQMPKMNGYKATEAIRALERPDSKTIPIVAMTADSFVQDEQAARMAGMDEHLSKPISVERLAQVLKRFLPNKTNNQKETGDAQV